MTDIDNPKRILILGAGVLGGSVLDFLSQTGRPYVLHVAARDGERTAQRANLTRVAALNLGFTPDVTSSSIDVSDIDATAALIARFKPDIIFNATTLHSWWVITKLPPEAFKRIDAARGGVWTPMHTVLTRRLMTAVREADSDAIVVNASYPDVVNAALSAEGLAPTIGIGNIANTVPVLRLAAARLLGRPVADVDIRIFAHHYFSYRMPSSGSSNGAPYHLSVIVDGRRLGSDEIDDEEVFRTVAGPLKRVRGLAGQAVTASSAVSVLRAFADGGERTVHAPGPLGLVGGYAVRVKPQGLALDLPDGLSFDQAVEINRQCQTFDGIAAVESDGSVRFTPESVAIMRDEIGYDCEVMPLADCEAWADELAARFAAYCRRLGIDEIRAA